MSLLLDEDAADKSTGLQGELESHIVELYQKLLSYQIRCAIVYHKSRTATIVRDAIKLNDWAAQIRAIENAEAAVQREARQYNSEQVKLNLQTLANTAKHQETKLQDIHSAIQDQDQLQENRDRNDRDQQCLTDLFLTYPKHDKTRIQETKGEPLFDSYCLILNHPDFQQWRNDD